MFYNPLLKVFDELGWDLENNLVCFACLMNINVLKMVIIGWIEWDAGSKAP